MSEVFKENLKDLIEDKGLSLRKIEKESGISSSQYSRYLKGIIPSIEVLTKIAKYFNCSIDYLVGFEEDKGYYKEHTFSIDKFLDNYSNYLSARNITHWKFAQANNFNEACLRHWKNGEVPKTTTLITIAQALNITLEELIFWWGFDG